MIVGAAMVIQAPHLPYSMVFAIFGWMLILTTAVLLVIPWTWHRGFAERVLPRVVSLLPLIGAAAIAMGSGLMFCLMRSKF
jgi:hypothetical protein